jgi:hypothetical protein
MKLLISLKELKHSIWIVILLTLIFGFNDGSEVFVLNFWLKNLFSIFILVVITILAHMIGAKLAANRFDQEAELELVAIKLPNKLRSKIKSAPLAAIIGFLIMLISKGTFYFTAISTITINKIPRLGKGFSLDETKESFIYFWALVANLILLVIFNFLNIKTGVVIGIYFILWNLLPIHGLLGSKIFFNNKILYVFFVIFTLTFLLLFTGINLLLLTLLAATIAFLGMMLWIFKKEYK